MAAPSHCRANLGATSQSISVTINNPANGGFSVGSVELTLKLSDLDLRDLAIELVSPDGTKALIAPNLHAAGDRTSLDFTFSSVVTLGENPFGTWTLNLTHATASAGFSVLHASIDIYGDNKGNDDTHYFTLAYARLVAEDPGTSITTDANGGTDTLNFAAAAGKLVLDLSGIGPSSLAGKALVIDGNFENAIGTTGSDVIAGSDAANTLVGDFGNDVLSGGDGHDVIRGGQGNDVLDGGHDADLIDGGVGIDLVSYANAGGSVADRYRARRQWRRGHRRHADIDRAVPARLLRRHLHRRGCQFCCRRFRRSRCRHRLRQWRQRLARWRCRRGRDAWRHRGRHIRRR